MNVCSRHGTSVALVLRDSAGDTQFTTACAVMAGRSLHRKSAPADAAAKKMSEAVSGNSAKNSEGKTPLELAKQARALGPRRVAAPREHYPLPMGPL